MLRSIGLDLANWEVRRRLFFYPEEPLEEGVSELRHSWKWLSGLPDEQLTPMWDKNGAHFYVGEVAMLENGKLVIPLRWFLRAGAMQMVYYDVHVTNNGLHVDETERRKGPASPLSRNLPDLLKSGIQTRLTGNRSKTWNKHWCFYFCAAGLPLACMNQEYFVHFVSTSQHAGPVEQVAAITSEIRLTEGERSVRDTGYVCNEALEGGGSRECLIIPGIFVETGDGPWQSELSSHSGDSKPCRFCEMGGNVKERSSDDGFLAIMEPSRNYSAKNISQQTGEPRTPADSVRRIQADLKLATYPRKGAEIEKNQQKTGTMDTLAQTVITELVEKGKEMFNEKGPSGARVHSNASIHATLEARLDERLEEGSFINSLLSDDRTSFSKSSTIVC
ncbi:hypothetical protein GSI_05123 [Ganoderma sinense ZZ0214-1]|uniref:Uncharacterized protein n=1 Tax=Ganoderma sinense ZZ0214-1 TaxID=1077348 RepID=A0A2G8SFA3_9APHY|nr:hypothetical protein GSI_05123 [Ganoderma sinense ZZ0214-1]